MLQHLISCYYIKFTILKWESFIKISLYHPNTKRSSMIQLPSSHLHSTI